MILDHRNVIVVGSAMLGLVACDKNDTDRTTTTTGAVRTTTATSPVTLPADPNDDAIDRITAARCRHELGCNTVGAGTRWPDDAACRRETRQNMQADMQRSECHVVLTDKVQSCIDSIRNEACGSVLDAIGRVSACRKNNLCED